MTRLAKARSAGESVSAKPPTLPLARLERAGVGRVAGAQARALAEPARLLEAPHVVESPVFDRFRDRALGEIARPQEGERLAQHLGRIGVQALGRRRTSSPRGPRGRFQSW